MCDAKKQMDRFQNMFGLNKDDAKICMQTVLDYVRYPDKVIVEVDDYVFVKDPRNINTYKIILRNGKKPAVCAHEDYPTRIYSYKEIEKYEYNTAVCSDKVPIMRLPSLNAEVSFNIDNYNKYYAYVNSNRVSAKYEVDITRINDINDIKISEVPIKWFLLFSGLSSDTTDEGIYYAIGHLRDNRKAYGIPDVESPHVAIAKLRDDKSLTDDEFTKKVQEITTRHVSEQRDGIKVNEKIPIIKSCGGLYFTILDNFSQFSIYNGNGHLIKTYDITRDPHETDLLKLRAYKEDTPVRPIGVWIIFHILQAYAKSTITDDSVMMEVRDVIIKYRRFI